jgi:UDP-N-acetylmuramyl pentapeptide phosphotransferase/UDP-N-acetylglucosamine-1-phosphate transferase
MILIGLIALGFSYFGVALLRRWTERRQILDVPNERSSHQRPTPLGGGLAIVVTTLLGIMLYAWIRVMPLTAEELIFGVGAILIAGVSWLDDLRPLPNRIRFTVHAISAIIAMTGLGYLRILYLPFFGNFDLGWLGLPLTFLWIVGLTNAYNFMDGIDGLAGGQAVIAGLGWAGLGWLSSQRFVWLVGMLVAASGLGFLAHNWPPARIFMGDVGSAFLGYTFAVLAIVAAQSEPQLAWAGVFLFWPFIFDTSFTFLRRLLRGENVFSAHRSHLYQRLVILGLSHSQVTGLYLGMAALGGILALPLNRPSSLTAIMSLLVILLACFGLWWGVQRRERRVAIKPPVERH